MRTLLRAALGIILVSLILGGEHQSAVGFPDPVLVAAGDISASASEGQQTANLILDQSKVPADSIVASLGDHAYENGTLLDFNNKYEPTWGVDAIRNDTKPTLGNHDAHTTGQPAGAPGGRCAAPTA